MQRRPQTRSDIRDLRQRLGENGATLTVEEALVLHRALEALPHEAEQVSRAHPSTVKQFIAEFIAYEQDRARDGKQYGVPHYGGFGGHGYDPAVHSKYAAPPETPWSRRNAEHNNPNTMYNPTNIQHNNPNPHQSIGRGYPGW